jgi:hypothetical protein
MDKQALTEKELEQLAYMMALALKDLDCPDCCGPVHAFIEMGAQRYREEWEWACLVQLVQHRHKIKFGGRS